jgi:hypothetical protein
MIGGTLFPHKIIHRGIWRSPDRRTVNQLGHVIIVSDITKMYSIFEVLEEKLSLFASE